MAEQLVNNLINAYSLLWQLNVKKFAPCCIRVQGVLVFKLQELIESGT
jgi:hypothetical protein